MQPLTRLVAVILRRPVTTEEGQDLLEYALLCALIALVANGVVTTVGQTIYSVFWKSIEVAF